MRVLEVVWKVLNQLSRMFAQRFFAPSWAVRLAFDTVIFSRSHDLFASSRSYYSSFDFTHVVYRLHRVAALKIMYFRGGVGWTFFLRSLRESRFAVCRQVSAGSLSSLGSRSTLSSRSSPSTRESRCNNGCPLIIERPRHFKKIPESPSRDSVSFAP